MAPSNVVQIIVGAVVFNGILKFILEWIGFTSVGVSQNSRASSIQSKYYGRFVKKGSIFAYAQKMAGWYGTFLFSIIGGVIGKLCCLHYDWLQSMIGPNYMILVHFMVKIAFHIVISVFFGKLILKCIGFNNERVIEPSLASWIRSTFYGGNVTEDSYFFKLQRMSGTSGTIVFSAIGVALVIFFQLQSIFTP